MNTALSVLRALLNAGKWDDDEFGSHIWIVKDDDWQTAQTAAFLLEREQRKTKVRRVGTIKRDKARG